MKKDEVKVDGTYLAKVNGGVVPVRITGEKWSGDKHVGWVGVNTKTNRSVRIKSAARLRGPVQGARGGEGAQEAATAAHAGEGAQGGAATPPKATGGTRGRKGATKPKGSHEVPSAKEVANNANLEAFIDAEPLQVAAASTGKQAGEAAKAPKTPKAAREPKPAKPRKTSALDAAAIVLAEACTPMKPKDMIALMEAKGLWTSPGGKTPEATLYAAIIREIAAKGTEARFKKTERGTFVATEHAAVATAGKEG